MNESREQLEPTPEGRIAGAAVTFMLQFRDRCGHLPDAADFRDHLRLPLQRELLRGRLEEAQRGGLLARARELLGELDELERRMAEPPAEPPGPQRA